MDSRQSLDHTCRSDLHNERLYHTAEYNNLKYMHYDNMPVQNTTIFPGCKNIGIIHVCSCITFAESASRGFKLLPRDMAMVAGRVDL